MAHLPQHLNKIGHSQANSPEMIHKIQVMVFDKQQFKTLKHIQLLIGFNYALKIVSKTICKVAATFAHSRELIQWCGQLKGWSHAVLSKTWQNLHSTVNETQINNHTPEENKTVETVVSAANQLHTQRWLNQPGSLWPLFFYLEHVQHYLQ